MKSALLVAAALLAGYAGSARASSCTLGAGTTGTMDFGTVNPLLPGDTVNDGGQIAVTCNFTVLAIGARLCFSLGVGNTSPSVAARAMGAGTNRMNYNLYTDPARSQVWGAATAGQPTSVTLTGPLLGGGNVSTTFRFYGKIPGGQSSVPTVANANTPYSETYATTGRLDVLFGLLSGLSNCPLAAPTQRITIPLVVRATVQKNCTISATDMAFPARGTLTSAVTASSQISVRCTNANAFSVALNGGSVAGNVSARRMKHATAADTVGYQLYQDAAYATVWGDASGGAPRAGVGTGANQTFTVYGRVPAQPTPRPGAYKDVITATITF
ncbi:Csu type fimbrial protein [Achromobacter arsenitoxydans]|uniref:Spore coat U domain-containing protein n=1 Tax=Achromobacter arsenitoxydans SY8 TaxID=477184 RepID=H0F9T0_9BURK|nr:spore coat U domain-containing protein [Achromobacter arsenitoxydans]EHK64924.1 spore coat U domain-containing protein [Achromobacter arsenitoxydans SY8]